MEYVSMGWVSERHTKLGNFLANELFNQIRKNVFDEKYFFSQGTTRLVYDGERYSGFERLVDVAKIADVAAFAADGIYTLHSVEPDVMLFVENPYLKNRHGSYLAGCPDLVIEIWSESNSLEERNFKHRLYATSPATEHWYLAQDSEIIERWLGNNPLPTATLREKMHTQQGLTIDISDIKL